MKRWKVLVQARSETLGQLPFLCAYSVNQICITEAQGDLAEVVGSHGNWNTQTLGSLTGTCDCRPVDVWWISGLFQTWCLQTFWVHCRETIWSLLIVAQGRAVFLHYSLSFKDIFVIQVYSEEWVSNGKRKHPQTVTTKTNRNKAQTKPQQKSDPKVHKQIADKQIAVILVEAHTAWHPGILAWILLFAVLSWLCFNQTPEAAVRWLTSRSLTGQCGVVQSLA